jgi:hypothetical protein
MKRKLPIVMFMMTKMMPPFVGMDYGRGLSMLKDYLETESVASKLAFPGSEQFQGFSYVGIETRCATDEVSVAMGKDMQRLHT